MTSGTTLGRHLRRTWVIALAVGVLTTFSSAARPASGQPVRDGARPTVWVLATGGTIAAVGSSATDLSNYKPGVITGEQVVAAVPQLAHVATVKVEQVVNIASYDITTCEWLTLARRINQIFAEDATVAGIVVTHGTATLEETAFFLNLTVKHDRPVVVVGSMRPATAMSADGPLNLYNAVRTAASAEARGKGVLVVMNDEINAARDVTKTNTLRLETFKSPDLGLLGYVDEDRVAFYRSPTRRHTTTSEFDVRDLTQLPAVDIALAYAEPGAAAIQAMVASGAKGLVIAATGAGSVSASQLRALSAALEPVPAATRPVIVRASRVGTGRVLDRDEFARLGMIPGDNLNPQKARILLMLALTKTTDPREIRRMFAEY